MSHHRRVANSVNTDLPSDDLDVFALLADQARDHDRSGLWMTAVGGALAAVAGFMAVALRSVGRFG